MITIYSVLLESKIKFTRFDIQNIGVRVRQLVEPIKKKKVAHDEVIEGKSEIAFVNVYEDDKREAIEKIILNYFDDKTFVK